MAGRGLVKENKRSGHWILPCALGEWSPRFRRASVFVIIAEHQIISGIVNRRIIVFAGEIKESGLYQKLKANEQGGLPIS